MTMSWAEVPLPGPPRGIPNTVDPGYLGIKWNPQRTKHTQTRGIWMGQGKSPYSRLPRPLQNG